MTRRLNGRPPSGTVQSVSRALQVLEVVATARDGITARDVADRLAIAVPSVYHVLSTLVEAGYVVHLSQEHRYGLGYRVRMLDHALQRQLAVDGDVAEVVARLHVEADAAAYYAVYRDFEVVIAHVVDSPRRPRVQILDIGFHEATHATAFGKVMLAAMEPEQRDRYLSSAGMPALTKDTIVDRTRLESHLRHVRDASIALEMGEFQPGLSCMAAPVRSPAGEVIASLAISVPSADFDRRRWEIERALRTGATRVTRVLRRACPPASG